MSDQQFDIIFRGDIVLGHQIGDVKQRLAQLFKADTHKINALFTGAAVPLKRNLDKTTAEKYKAVLIKAGAQVDIAVAGSVKASPKPATRPARSVARSPAIPPAPPASPAVASPAAKKSMSLQERLEAAEAERLIEEARAKEAAEAEAGFTLAPLGADVLVPEERHEPEPLQVDTSQLSVAAMEGDLLADDEKRPAVEVDLDLSEFDLAEAGADMVRAEEKTVIPAVAVDVSGIDLAEAGEDLVREDEKLPLAAVEVDVSELDLAPVGSDMGQKARQSPPPPPDTSSISLAD